MCSFVKELIQHTVYSYLKATRRARQDMGKNLASSFISALSISNGNWPSTYNILKSLPSLKKPNFLQYCSSWSIPSHLFLPFGVLNYLPCLRFSLFHCHLSGLSKTYTVTALPCLKSSEVFLPLNLMGINTDIALCSWVSAPLTNLISSHSLPAQIIHPIPWCFQNSHHFSFSLSVLITIPLCRWLFPINTWWSLLASQYPAQVTSLGEA